MPSTADVQTETTDGHESGQTGLKLVTRKRHIGPNGVCPADRSCHSITRRQVSPCRNPPGSSGGVGRVRDGLISD